MSKTILIVDDSSSVRTVVATALKGAGYIVVNACDGKDALSKLNGEKVHLIISDVNMPNPVSEVLNIYRLGQRFDLQMAPHQ